MDAWIIDLIPSQEAAEIISQMEHVNELRFSAGELIVVRCDQKEYWVGKPLSALQVESVVKAACKQSVYAHTETLRHGYLALDGGYRMGICGCGVVRDGAVQNLVSPSSLVIRFPGEKIGFANSLMHCSESVLILGPPGSGKTTLLRDFIRQQSDVNGLRIGLADERGEISAMYHGHSGLQIGRRTDVLVHVPKTEAVMMLLRTMNPQWIAMDEISAPDDLDALQMASYCGVKLAATAHGASMDDLYRRPLYANLMKLGIFSYISVLKPDRTYEIVEVHQ